MTLHHGLSGQCRTVRFTNRRALGLLEPDKSEAWCTLDVAYLHRYLIDELYVRSGGRTAPEIRYTKKENEVKRIATDEHGVALISEPTTMAQLRAVSDAGDLMPPKSTYFFPKVATGLTINPLR